MPQNSFTLYAAKWKMSEHYKGRTTSNGEHEYLIGRQLHPHVSVHGGLCGDHLCTSYLAPTHASARPFMDGVHVSCTHGKLLSLTHSRLFEYRCCDVHTYTKEHRCNNYYSDPYEQGEVIMRKIRISCMCLEAVDGKPEWHSAHVNDACLRANVKAIMDRCEF